MEQIKVSTRIVGAKELAETSVPDPVGVLAAANTALFATFDGEFSGVNQLYAGKGGFKYLW